jgi:hypothetical protein
MPRTAPFTASENASIFPSDNVAAVVEVKSRLDKDRLEEAYENIRAAKQLSKSKAPDVPFLITTSTLGVLFAFDSALTLDKVSAHYRALLVGNSLADHIDVIAVLDRGMILDLALAELDVCVPDALGDVGRRAPREREHLVVHVDPDHASAGADHLSGDEAHLAGARTEIEHGLACTHVPARISTPIVAGDDLVREGCKESRIV